MNQSCQLLRTSARNVARLQRFIPTFTLNGHQNVVASPQVTQNTHGPLELPAPTKIPATSPQLPICRIPPHPLLVQYATLMLQSAANPLLSEDRACDLAQQLQLVLRTPILPSIVALVGNPGDTKTIARRFIASLIQADRFTEVTALLALFIRHGLCSSSQDLRHIALALNRRFLHSPRSSKAASGHLSNYLVSLFRRGLIEGEMGRDQELATQIAISLIFVMHRSKNYSAIQYLQYVTQKHHIPLNPSSYNLILESLLRDVKLEHEPDRTVSTLASVMKQMDNQELTVTVELKAHLLRVLGKVLQHQPGFKQLSSEESWRNAIGRTIGLDGLALSLPDIGPNTSGSQNASISPQVHPSLLLTWADILISHRESSPFSTADPFPHKNPSQTLDPLSLSHTIQLVLNREWNLPSPDAEEESPVQTQYAVDQVIIELKRSETLARFSLLNGDLLGSLRYLGCMYRYSRRYNQRWNDHLSSPVAREAQDRELAILRKGARTMATRLDATLKRIWDRVRQEKRLGTVRRSLVASRVVPIDSPTFHSIWKSSLCFMRKKNGSDRSLADALAILSQIMDAQEVFSQQKQESTLDSAKRRSKQVKQLKGLFSDQGLIPAIVHSIINRSLAEAKTPRGNVATKVFKTQLEMQLDVMKRLGLSPPEELHIGNHLKSLKRLYPNGECLIEMIARALKEWRSDLLDASIRR